MPILGEAAAGAAREGEGGEESQRVSEWAEVVYVCDCFDRFFSGTYLHLTCLVYTFIMLQ